MEKKSLAEGLEILKDPEIMRDGIKYYAVFEMEASRAVYKQFISATIKNGFSAFIKGNASDRRVYAKVDENNNLELRLVDETVVNSSGYDKNEVLGILDTYMDNKYFTTLLPYIKREADKYAEMIKRAGIEFIQTSVKETEKKERYYVHGADFRSKPLFDEFSGRVPLDVPPKMDSSMLIVVSDKFGAVSKDGVQLAIVDEAANHYENAPLPVRDSELGAIGQCTELQVMNIYKKKQEEAEKKAIEKKEKEKEKEKKEKEERQKQEILAKAAEEDKLAQAIKAVDSKSTASSRNSERTEVDAQGSPKMAAEISFGTAPSAPARPAILDLDGISAKTSETEESLIEVLKNSVPKSKSSVKEDELDDELDFLRGKI